MPATDKAESIDKVVREAAVAQRQAALEPTPADQWHKQSTVGFIVTLPSGHNARITRSDFFLELLKTNTLPNPLANIVGDMIKAGDKAEPPDIASVVDELGADVVPTLINFMDEVAIKVMVEPRVERRPEPEYTGDQEHDLEERLRVANWQPTSGAIELSDLTTEDRAYLFQVAMGGATDLDSFRAQQNQTLAAPHDGRKVQRPAKRASRTKKAAK